MVGVCGVMGYARRVRTSIRPDVILGSVQHDREVAGGHGRVESNPRSWSGGALPPGRLSPPPTQVRQSSTLSSSIMGSPSWLILFSMVSYTSMA